MRRFIDFEHRRQPLATHEQFTSRLSRNGFWAVVVIGLWEVTGMSGYMGFENMSPVDAFLNAAMILSGMGPVTPLVTTGGKVFAGFYAIASGLLIFGVAGLILAPIFHRVLHRFHVSESSNLDQ